MRLDDLSPLIIAYRYWILVPLSLLEGPTVAFVTGTLSSLGYFNVYLAYAIFVAKDMFVDGLYYYLGRFAAEKPFVKRWLTKARVTTAEIAHIRSLWDRQGWRTMCIGKLSWGLSPAFLAVAGIVAVPPARFFRYAVGIAFLQYAVLFALGYYFGRALGTVSQALRIIQFVAAGAALAAIIYARGRLRARSASR